MLTSDLIKVRRKKDLIVPVYLHGPAVERLTPIIGYYADTLAAMIDRTRDEIDAAMDAAHVPARDRVAALGLRKVLEDRAAFEIAEGVDPEALRAEVFAASAAAYRDLDVRADLDRDAVIAAVAARLGTTAETIERGLYADLHGSELLKSFSPISTEEVIARYNLGLAQAVLLRATRVTVHLEGEEPAVYRRIFRAARFHGLLHVVKKGAESGYDIELDGPYSLFDSVQRYGLKLALFLPSILSCRAFHLKAEILWGRERTPAVLEITPKDELVSLSPEPAASAVELEVFVDAWKRLESAWTVSRNDRIFALPGEVVCVPDLVFKHRETGEKVYLEAFGFWSRAAVWQRVELIRRGFPARILLCVSKQLRVSEEVLGDDDAGEIYVYKRTISPREVLDRLERGSRAREE